MNSNDRAGPRATLPLVRCAVYTRKSTEEGLEQEFNSLDAQREAGEAYVRSQAGLGWALLPDRYDDGGFTGGNMDRPALQRLKADIQAGRIDCVVVYKVDRLSRSLLDFARLMETFERHQVAFVSVTQLFNTASSMGRLILNVLLSFAQFEREIIAERTRDKIAATRRKGKWAGGRPLLGFDVDPRGGRLLVNAGEAERVRAIFALYLEHQALLPVVQELERRGWANKCWQTRKGRPCGGRPFTKTGLHRLLTNVTYVGRVRYKDEVHQGEQPPLVDAGAFQRVGQVLAHNGPSLGPPARNRPGALLKGLLRCGPCGSAMTPSHCAKGARRYRYYTCVTAQKRGWHTCPSKSIPAAQIEALVVEQVQEVGRDPALLHSVLEQARQQGQGQTAELEAEGRALEHDLARWQGELHLLSGQLRPGEDNGSLVARLAELQGRVALVVGRVQKVRAQIRAVQDGLLDEGQAATALALFDPVWQGLSPGEQARVLGLLVQRVDYDGARGKVSYVDGVSLAHYLARRQAKGRPLAPKEVVHVLRPVCQALEYAQAQGVCHRDVKPHNVMLSKGGGAKLTDFGIARVLKGCGPRLTREGDVGTPVYMPPDRDFDARSDVYLLGNMLLELLTFDPRGDVEARADCPPAWAELVADSMNRLKGKRPQTARDFLARLERGSAGSSSRAAAPGPAKPVTYALAPEEWWRNAAPPLNPAPPQSAAVTPAARSLDDIRALIEARRYEEAMSEYRRLPHERQSPALLNELLGGWRDYAHAQACNTAGTDHDYAGAVARIERLPESLRAVAALAEYRARRDRLAQLRAGIDEDVRNNRHTFYLRARVAEYRRLKPNDPAINELHGGLGDLPREITNALGVRLVMVRHGTFWMGDRGGQRPVSIPSDYYIGAYPVTQGQWRAVMDDNPSWFSRRGTGANEVKGVPDGELEQFPVECVSWRDVQEFLRRVNLREEGGGLLYRVPSEAEWEFACRGGATTQAECAFDFYVPQLTNDLSDGQANFNGNVGRTTKVGSYKPNRLGISDMHGNVWEGCESRVEGDAVRAIRGGHWRSNGPRCRAPYHLGDEPFYRNFDLGLRLVAALPKL